MKTPQFEVQESGKILNITFKKLQVAKTFASMEFFSRLLHSLSPDEYHVWREKSRLDAEISGWPKNIKWSRTGELSFKGEIIGNAPFSVKQYTQILEAAMEGVTNGEVSPSGSKVNRIAMGNGSQLAEYHFHSKSRAIAALYVLYDLEPHPRNDLEINIPKNLGVMKWPPEASEEHQRTYGDPSKAADELRNEGWSRMGKDAAMKVFYQKVDGQTQQTYQLLKKEQTLESQMQRSNISRKWRDELYKSQDYTCQICLLKYESELLAPDHRVPVIYEADQLTEENYKQKLMTLCRFCNQQKRETTKRLPPDYDWQNSPWAFPEKFALDIIKRRIESHIQRTGLPYDEIIKMLRR